MKMMKTNSTNRSVVRAAAILGIAGLSLVSAIGFSSCKNPIAEAAQSAREGAASARMVLSAAAVSVASGDTINFGQVSVGSVCDVSITIGNTGKSNLEIDISNIKLIMGADTAAATFIRNSAPAGTIAINASSTMILRFAPASGGAKTATVTIPTNDATNPTFIFKVEGTGWPVALTTNAITSILTTTATGGGNITSDGGVAVTERGICWDTSPNPTTSNKKQADAGTGLGSYAEFMTGLTAGTLYYVRAYATNGIATGYGSQVSFTTLPTTPAVSTVNAKGNPSGSGQLYVAWTAVNGAAVYYDVYYSTTNTFSSAITGQANVSSTSCSLTGLTNYTSYYVWIVAKNATGSSSPSPTMSVPVAPGIHVTGVSLVAQEKLPASSTDQLTPTITPPDATNPNVTWSSSASSLAAVSATGLLTGAGIGNATVTVTTVDQGKTASCMVAITGIMTIAGNGTRGYTTVSANGAATSTAIGISYGIALGSSGNVYIADSDNYCVRKVTIADGTISTIAGTGISGVGSGDGGLATSARFMLPGYVVVTSANTIYIADTSDQRIRLVTSAGLITTAAGNGTNYYSSGFADGGAATSSRLDRPASPVVDSLGNLYFADQEGNRIRKVSTSNIITTIAGPTTGTGAVAGSFSGDGGPATSATLKSPAGLAIDSSGNIFFADCGNNRVRKINASNGYISTIAGTGTDGYSGDGGPATSAKLSTPESVAVDSAGNVYIVDNGNSVIRKVTISTGYISTVVGNGVAGFGGDGGAALSAELKYPTSIAVDSLGNLFISDGSNCRIRKVVQ
jgi:hypothetical protein